MMVWGVRFFLLLYFLNLFLGFPGNSEGAVRYIIARSVFDPLVSLKGPLVSLKGPLVLLGKFGVSLAFLTNMSLFWIFSYRFVVCIE